MEMQTDLQWVQQQALANSGRLAELNRVRRGLRLVMHKLDRRIAQCQQTQGYFALAIESSGAIPGLQSHNTDIHDPAAAA
jgi:hypothetical protein